MMGSRWPNTNMTGFRSLVFLQFYSLLFLEIRKSKNTFGSSFILLVGFYLFVFCFLFFQRNLLLLLYLLKIKTKVNKNMRQKIKTFIGITKYTLVNRNYQAVITTVTIGRLI